MGLSSLAVCLSSAAKRGGLSLPGVDVPLEPSCHGREVWHGGASCAGSSWLGPVQA